MPIYYFSAATLYHPISLSLSLSHSLTHIHTLFLRRSMRSSRSSSSLHWRRGVVHMRSSVRKRMKLSSIQKAKAVRSITPLQRKLRQLQKIIPGSDDMDVDSLFQTTASYIFLLESQVSFLRKLSSFYGI